MTGPGYRAIVPALALAVVLGAGAAILGGGAGAHRQPAGIYRAVISGRYGSQTVSENVWYSVPDGRFRDSDVNRLNGQPGARSLTVFDGVQGRTTLSGRGLPGSVIDYHGSPAFTADIAGGLAINIVASYLQGTPPPPGVRVQTTHSGGATVLVARGAQTRYRLTVRPDRADTAARLFRMPGGRVNIIETQIQLTGPHAAGGYWLGPPAGAQAYAFIDGHGDLSVLYPNLEVDTFPTVNGGRLPGRRIRVGGSPAGLVTSGPDGTVRVGSGSSFVEITAGSGRFPGLFAAVVFTPSSMITLTGPALTSANAADLARRLRQF